MRSKSQMVWRAATILLLAAGGAVPLRAEQVRLDVQTSNPVLAADARQTVYIKVGLTGLEPAGDRQRAPINVAIVLDKSGSMSGAGKIEEARRAALQAIETLGPDDIVSVVTYDSTVNVLVPATKLSDRARLAETISRIQPGGQTALFAGVSKGADELRKFIEKERVSRIVLLSDGLANVGPSAPGDLADLGESLRKEGISVSTVGLGLDYNEDLMSKLASRSDGNHYFVENARDLARIYEKELGRVQTVVAKAMKIDITCGPGVRPVRVMGREAEIVDGRIWLEMNQIFADLERNVLLEVEVAPSPAGASRELARAAVRYTNVLTGREERLAGTVTAGVSESSEAVSKAINAAVMVPVVELIAVENNARASLLRDQGKIAEAQKLLMYNNGYLLDNGNRFNSKKLEDYGVQQKIDADNLTGKNWPRQRKQMREIQDWALFGQ